MAYPPVRWRYITKAVEFWHAARCVYESGVQPWYLHDPTVFLISQSFELTLKYYLLGERGPKEFRKFFHSHNLNELLKAAVESGLELDQMEATCIAAMHHGHLKHTFRYGLAPDANQFHAAHLHLAIPSAANLIDRVVGNPDVLRSVYGQNGNRFEYRLPPPMKERAVLPFVDALFVEFAKPRGLPSS